MVKLICAVAAHLSTEQCFDVSNVFKVNCKGNGVAFFEVSRSRWYFYWLIQTCLSHGFGLVSLSEERLVSLVSRWSQIHWLKCCNVELKTALLEFIGMIVAMSNIFPNVNNSDTVIVKMFQCTQKRLMQLCLYFWI